MKKLKMLKKKIQTKTVRMLKRIANECWKNAGIVEKKVDTNIGFIASSDLLSASSF